MVKIFFSEVSEDSYISYMPVVKFSPCLGVGTYLALIEKSNF